MFSKRPAQYPAGYVDIEVVSKLTVADKKTQALFDPEMMRLFGLPLAPKNLSQNMVGRIWQGYLWRSVRADIHYCDSDEPLAIGRPA